MKKRIILMYISNDSGHHKASLAVEKSLKLQEPDVETMNVNSFNFTNPILEKIINQTYMSVIRNKPEFWGYLYDNPKIVQRTQKLREAMHRFNNQKLKQLIEQFQADAVVCTQAFPCGMVADYKKTHNSSIKLYGILTDYAPHSYWIFDKVDGYFVPCVETGAKLIKNGVPPEKVIDSGIPIDPVFKMAKDKNTILQKYGLDKDKPIFLIMGGSQGLGPMKEVFASLMRSQIPAQLIVIAGRNRGVYRWFEKQKKTAERAGRKMLVFGFAEGIDEMMEVSALIISKPGGITTAEALAKGLPMLIISPIPGQEQMNTEYFLKNNVAIKIDDPSNTSIIVEELFYNRTKLDELARRAKMFSMPDSAMTIAAHVLRNF